MKFFAHFVFISFISSVACICSRDLECILCIKSRCTFYITKDGPLCAPKKPDFGVLIPINLLSRCAKLTTPATTTTTTTTTTRQPMRRGRVYIPPPDKVTTVKPSPLPVSPTQTIREWSSPHSPNKNDMMENTKNANNTVKLNGGPTNPPGQGGKMEIERHVPSIIPIIRQNNPSDAIMKNGESESAFIIVLTSTTNPPLVELQVLAPPPLPTPSSTNPPPINVTNKLPQLEEKTKARFELFSAMCTFGNKLNEYKRVSRGKDLNDEKLLMSRKRKCMRMLEF